MTDMTRQYAEAALWSSVDWDDIVGDNPEPMDLHYSTDDLADETWTLFRADCDRFYRANLRDLRQTGADAGQWGHDLWLTRNHHGTGFWDRGYGPCGDRLTDAAHDLGETTLYVGDDGKVYAE